MRFIPVLAISIASLTLVGCSTSAPKAVPTSSAVEQAPAFASDEEALAAAQAAYAEYLSVSDQIARDGGANPERLKKLVSSNLFEEMKSTFNSMKNDGLHAEGVTTFDSLHLENRSVSNASFYLCVDVSQNLMFNASGENVTPSNRMNRVPLVVNFAFHGTPTIESSEVWSCSI